MKIERHSQIIRLISQYDIETQEELADRSELSKGFISQLERDLTSPSIATLTDILQIVGSIAGDNTLMCVARSVDEGLVLMEKIRKMIV